MVKNMIILVFKLFLNFNYVGLNKRFLMVNHEKKYSDIFQHKRRSLHK